MPSPKPITIVGGGLAGLTLGIGLRHAGIPVTVLEAGHYPRHRVCGEFISGRGQKVLERLELKESIVKSGAHWARTAQFFFGTSASLLRPLPSPAWSVSRFTLDALLAEKFRRLGGELREGERQRESTLGEGMVCARGRRAQPSEGGHRWFGLKAHGRNVPLTADLEMHALGNGYVGLTRLEDGVVNVCGLFRRKAADAAHQKPLLSSASNPLIRELGSQPGTPLFHRLANAAFDEASLCSVAGLPLRPQSAAGRNECCIGDALTMIPPVTGNGMSMAFESAEIAAGPLEGWSRGTLSWNAARQAIARDCDRLFGRRLAWARLAQWMMFAPILQGRLGAFLLRSDLFWRQLFACTR